MPRPCSACQRKDVAKIAKARFVEHLSYNAIADRFGLSKGAVVRHFEHVEEPRGVEPEGAPPPGLPTDLATVPHPALPSAGRPCAVCSHENSAEITRSMALGYPMLALSTQHDLSIQGLERHKRECLAEWLERARCKLTAGTILEQIDGLKEEIREFLEMARGSNDLRAWGVAIQRAERSIALLAKVTRDLEGDEEAFLRSRFWEALRAAHERALAPYPEAAAALKAELAQALA